MRRIRHFLALILTVTMLMSNMLTTYASTLLSVQKSASTSGTTAVRISNIDPEDLNVPRVGTSEASADEIEEPAYMDSDLVRVSIVLEGKSTIDAGYSIEDIGRNKKAISYRNNLEKQQNTMSRKISREALSGKELDVKWNLTLVANIIAAEVRYGDIEKIAKVSGVKEVVIENTYILTEEDAQPMMTNARDMTGSNGVNATKYKGAGSRLAIIDTGLDIEHQSFNEDAFLHAIDEDGFPREDLLTLDELSEVWTQLNFYKRSTSFTADGSYYNAKIPFMGNYVDRSQNVTHLNDTQEEHGSHVSGIATANRYLKTDDGSFIDAAEAVGVVGQAPDAQILVMKVFGAGGGASDSDYMAAIEDAIVLKADSVNLSLGSSAPGTSYNNTSATYQAIFDNLASKGIVVCISAGNNTSWDSQKQLYADDINYHTGGSPGSFTNSLTVASIDDTGVAAPYILFDNSLEARYNELAGGTVKQPLTSVEGTYTYVYIDTVGNPAEFNALADLINGNIALCNRGEINFSAKAEAAVAVGAVATIIVNNQAGSLSSSTVGDAYAYTNPVAGILQSVGQQIKASSEAHTADGFTYYTGTIKIGGAGDLTPLSYYTMSTFSAWGVPGSLVLKPEITAPGGSVLSLNGYHRNASGGGYSGGHDQYELMSGTSMAAPQMTGISAAIGQYYRQENIQEKTGLSARHFAQGMIMATAVPVKEEASGHYYSLLNQGAGLVNLEAVVTAKSYIRMAEDDNTITAMLGLAADGKVKAEVGDDPARTGKFEYSFTITNFSDESVTYRLSTDLFTQALENNNTLLSHQTTPIGGTTAYEIAAEQETHDVNKDGKTDNNDVQAILDYITGKVSADDLDLAAAEIDGNKGISTRDALALLTFLKAQGSGSGSADSFTLDPGKSATVKVKIDISADTVLTARENGGYLEGFTFIKSDNDVTYSIPVLGYYGSWTDPSMFDAVTYAEKLYGSEQTSYFNANNTNGLRIKTNATATDQFVVGNPYVVEEKFPADRLAIGSQGVIYSAQYTLIRYSAASFSAITDAEGTVKWMSSISRNQANAYYNTQSSTPSWMSTNSRTASINQTVGNLGFKEGDKFTAGLYALPEYYGFVANNGSTNVLTDAQARELLTSGVIGKGALMGFTFTVDDTKPTVDEVSFTDDKVIVTVSDNSYIAYVALMDVSGRNTYAGVVPEQSAPGSTITLEFDKSAINSNAVVIFVGDYAGNEDAALYRIGEGDIMIERDIYVLTDTLAADKDYLIISSNVVGDAVALSHNGTTKSVDPVVIREDSERGLTIDGKEVEETSVFTAFTNGNGVGLVNNGYYLAVSRTNISFSTSAPAANRYFTYDGDNSRLAYASGNSTYYVRYNNGSFTGSSSAYSVYIFERQTYTEVFDENAVEEVVVTPATATVYVGGEPLALTAEVFPVTLSDRTVTWSSSDETIATVDEDGVVTGLANGTVTISATANMDNATAGTATITVVELLRIDAEIRAQVSDSGGDSFVRIDLSNGKTTTLGACAAQLLGGGRSDNVLVGFTSSNQGEVVVTGINGNEYSSSILGTFGTSTYNMRDGAHIPTLSGSNDEETIVEHYDSIYVCGNYMLLMDATVGSITGWNYANNTGIAYAGTNTTTMEHYYYVLSGTTLNMAVVAVDSEEPIVVDEDSGEHSLNISLGTGTVGSISGLTVSNNDMSLALLNTEDYYGLLIANGSNKTVYFVNLNTEDALTAERVLVLDKANRISALHDDVMDTNVVPIQSIDGRDRFINNIDKASMQIMSAQKIAEIVPAKVKAAGTLNSVTSAAFVNQPVNKRVSVAEIPGVRPLTTSGESTTGDDGSAIVEIKENELFNNGMYIISYNTEELTFIEGTSDCDFFSIENDAENGTVSIAAIDLEGIEAGKAIVTVTFDVGCNNATVTINTKELNEELELDDKVDVTVQGTGHDWGEPVWTWADDNSSATASFTCKNDPTHHEDVPAEISEEITKEPTVDETGIKIITATVTGPDGETYTDTRTEIIPAIEPDVPDTGDHSRLSLYASMTVASLFGMILVVYRRKKEFNGLA